MALRILGIDLGTHSVKVAELRSSFRTQELIGFWQAPLGPTSGTLPTLEEQLAALATLSLTVGTRADVVVVSLPGAGTATHRLSFPFSDSRRLEQTLGFEVEGQIPFDLADVVYDYDVLSQVRAKGKGVARTELLVGVARRAAVSDLMAGLTALGLDPRIVTLPGLALQQLPLPLDPKPGGSDAVLDLGHSRSNLVIRDSGRAIFARSFDGGGLGLTLALARAGNLSIPEAEVLKERSSLLQGDPETQQLLTRALLPVIREVRQTLKQVEGLAKKGADRLWLTGGTASLDGLPELLARELGIEVTRVSSLPLEGKTPGKSLGPEEARQGSLALGLALRGHTGNRKSRFNLRRGDQTFQGDLTRLRGKLMRYAAVSLVLLLLFGVRAYAEIYLLQKREKQIDDAICAQTKQAVGKCVKDPVVARSLLAATSGPGETVIPELSAVGLLAETTGRMNVEGAKVTEMDVAIDQLQLRGEADAFPTIEKVVSSLKGYHCFTDVQQGSSHRSRDNAVIEFNLSVRNDCGAGGGTP